MTKKVTFSTIVKTTYEVEQVSPEDGVVFDFTKFMETRNKYRMGIGDRETHCKKCEKPFQDGDRMYMAITNRGNLFLCKECARKLRRALGKPDYCKPENLYLNNLKK